MKNYTTLLQAARILDNGLRKDRERIEAAYHIADAVASGTLPYLKAEAVTYPETFRMYWRKDELPIGLALELFFRTGDRSVVQMLLQEDKPVHVHEWVSDEYDDFEGSRCAECGAPGGWWCPSGLAIEGVCVYGNNDICCLCGEPSDRK